MTEKKFESPNINTEQNKTQTIGNRETFGKWDGDPELEGGMGRENGDGK